MGGPLTGYTFELYRYRSAGKKKKKSHAVSRKGRAAIRRRNLIWKYHWISKIRVSAVKY